MLPYWQLEKVACVRNICGLGPLENALIENFINGKSSNRKMFYQKKFSNFARDILENVLKKMS